MYVLESHLAYRFKVFIHRMEIIKPSLLFLVILRVETA